jgi:hypothetical protein
LKFVHYTKIYDFRLSKTIHAPLHFVYDWCTDYRETDPKLLTGDKSRRKILLRTERRVVYSETYRSNRDEPTIAVNVVTRHPYKGWHLDYVSDWEDDVGDYALTSLGPRKTRISFTFTVHFKIDKPRSKEQYASIVSKVWDKYAQALEKDYHRTRRQIS